MQIPARILSYQQELTAIRQQIHAAPELLFDVHLTADLVAQKLREYGVDEIVTGIGRTGVVAVINGTHAGPVIGLRADMDALPIQETTGLTYASKTGTRPCCLARHAIWQRREILRGGSC
jgi:hippurate hydrolase